MICIWMIPLVVLIVLICYLNFVYEWKQSEKKRTLTSKNGFLIVLKLSEKLIPSGSKSLARKFHKVLGTLWNFEIDELFFDLKNIASESHISTKREFLQVLSSVYDPLSVVSPTIITLKFFFKRFVWRKKLGRCTTWKNTCWMARYSWRCKCYEN